MAKLFVVAGPPASGKSTLIKLLANPYPSWRLITTNFFDFLPILKEKKELEKIFDQDFKCIKDFSLKKNTVLENGILNAVYYHLFLGVKKTEAYFLKTQKIYQKLHPLIFYIDTKPEISFRRQQEDFKKLLHKNGIIKPELITRYLTLYQKSLYDLYPLFERYLNKLPFEKITLKNSYITQEEFIRQSFFEFQKITLT